MILWKNELILYYFTIHKKKIKNIERQDKKW